MRLNSLLKYNKILIQCHDNPDPDAIASGYGLYEYFKANEKDVHFLYAGRDKIQKANIKLMVKALDIPIQYIDDMEEEALKVTEDTLLITVDCQYGENNVSALEAQNVVIIDHHQVSSKLVMNLETMEIHSELGSCSTLVWRMLGEENFPTLDNHRLCTSLYYGLITDTGEFSELSHPLDKDMKDDLPFDRMLVNQLNNSKISLEELEIAGVALIKYIYNSDHRYALIHAKPCDPNVLGYIIDLVLQVDVIDTCVVFNDKPNGFKFSVRSCIKDVHANELAAYIAEDLGGGGGHIDKAGGFISLAKYEENQKDIAIDTYMAMRLNNYFSTSEIIYCKDYEIDTSDMKLYQKKDLVLGFVDPLEFVEKNSEVLIRTLEGDVRIKATGDFYIMIGILGEVYPIKKDRFERDYKVVPEAYELHTEYLPSLRCLTTGENFHDITVFAKSCQAGSRAQILAKPVDHIHKIYTMWDKDNYYLGNPGDYIACRESDPKDVYIIRKDVFALTYEEIV